MKKFILFRYLVAGICIFAFLTLASCGYQNPIPVDGQKTGSVVDSNTESALVAILDDNANNTDTHSLSSEFPQTIQVRGGKPNQLCVLSLKLDVSKVTFQRTKKLSILVDDPSDKNGNRVGAKVISDDSKNIILKRVLMLNDIGELNCLLKIGNSDDVSGKYNLLAVEVNPIEEDLEYCIYESENSSIRAVFCKSDISETGVSEKHIQENIEMLSSLRKSLKSFVYEQEPFNGVSTYICTEEMQMTGLAGNPIYINREDVPYLLNTISTDYNKPLRKDYFITVFCHEMSHTFDGINSEKIKSNYNFDKEFFAILKEIYALTMAGYSLDDEFLTVKPSLDSGIYNYEVFLDSILKRLELPQNKKNWQSIKETMHSINNVDLEYSEMEAFEAFIEILSEKSGVDLKSSFSDKAWKTLCNQYNKPKLDYLDD